MQSGEDRYFYKIKESAYLASNSFVSDMREKMKKYYLPPQFDFEVQSRLASDSSEIQKFVMYIFEYHVNLTGDDMANVWQGLQPSTAYQTVNTEKTEENNLLSNLPNDLLQTGDEETIKHRFSDLGLNLSRFEKDTRWLVFKAKRRSSTAGRRADINNFFAGREDPEHTGEYNYNWPHDYYSIVELASLDIEYESSGIELNQDIEPQSERELEQTIKTSEKQGTRKLLLSRR